MPIFDQGYQHWKGPLSGHGRRWLSIALQGTRVQLKRRGVRGLLFMAWLPALALVIFMALWGMVEKRSEGVMALLQNFLPPGLLDQPSAYRGALWTMAYSYFFRFQMFFIMLLVAIAGPGLISSDLRFNALPLYFSRPLNRFDYFLGKLGVIGTLVAAVAVVPAVIAYVVGLCFSLDPGIIKDTWQVVPASIAYGLIVTLSAGTLILALSSLTRRSLYVGIAWAGLWIISGATAQILVQIYYAPLQRRVFEAQMTAFQVTHAPRRALPRGAPPGFGGEPDLKDPRIKKVLEDLRQAKAEQDEALRNDWRPLFSYVGNLERVSDRLLGTEAARASLAKLAPRSDDQIAEMAFGGPPGARRQEDEPPGPTQPWEWSAGVLAGLLGLSTWTLTSRVKSLDRLK
jgi:ABC-2 type transport system permease protein